MIPMLEPLFPGSWRAFGETLGCGDRPPAEAVPVSALLSERGLLDQLIRRSACARGVAGPDLRAAASAWSCAYLWCLMPPVVLAASALQHVFPVEPERLYVCFGEQGEARCFHILQPGRAHVGSSTAERYEALLTRHFLPLFTRIHQQTRLAPKTLWGNAARYLEVLLEHALQTCGEAARPVVQQDRVCLLDRPALFAEAPNPLCMPRRRVSGVDGAGEAGILLHRQCCLYYRLPGQPHCGACPLSPANRCARRTAGA